MTFLGMDLLPEISPVLDTFVPFMGNGDGIYNWALILMTGLGVSIAMVFVWWALRKVVGIVMGAFRNGTLKF